MRRFFRSLLPSRSGRQGAAETMAAVASPPAAEAAAPPLPPVQAPETRDTFAFTETIEGPPITIGSGTIRLVVPANLPIWYVYTPEGIRLLYEKDSEFKKEKIRISLNTFLRQISTSLQTQLNSLWNLETNREKLNSTLFAIDRFINPNTGNTLKGYNLFSIETPGSILGNIELPYLEILYKLEGDDRLLDFSVFRPKVMSDFYHFQQNIDPLAVDPSLQNMQLRERREFGRRRDRPNDPPLNRNQPVVNVNNPISAANELYYAAHPNRVKRGGARRGGVKGKTRGKQRSATGTRKRRN